MEPVEIYCRIKPIENNNNINNNNNKYNNCLTKKDDNLILNIPEQNALKYGKNKKLIFMFKSIFDVKTKQFDLAKKICSPIINDLFNGENTLLIGYGANNSGKKYTIYGNEKENGLLQSSLFEIFKVKESQQTLTDALVTNSSDTDETINSYQKIPNYYTSTSINNNNNNRNHNHNHNQRVPFKPKSKTRNDFHTVYLSYIEITNDSVLDLFENIVQENLSNENYKEDEKEEESLEFENKIFNEIRVDSYEESLELIKLALENRDAGFAQGHKILFIRLAHRYYSYSHNTKSNKSDYFMSSRLTILDLEYFDRSSNLTLRELESIKSSLMALRNCIEVYKEKNDLKKIPYKESKLTYLLKNNFKQNCKIKMILCLNPSVNEFDQTCNVLRFASLKSEALEVTLSSPPKTNPSCIKTSSQKSDISTLKHRSQSSFVEKINNNQEQNEFSFINQNNDSLELDYKINNLIDYLNEFKLKKKSIRIDESLNEDFVNKIQNLINDIGIFIGKTNSTSVNQIFSNAKAQSTLNNFETESLTRVSMLPKSPDHNSISQVSNQTTTLIETPTQIKPRIKKLTSQIKSRFSRFENFDFNNGIPVGNRRGQKRSKSVDVWLDHQPQNFAKLDTLMQPLIERKKSVKKIELKDTKRSSKYVLTHQQQDEYGEVVTNLIKGDIIKSPTGGSSVIFTDVERLLLKSPQIPRPKITKQAKGALEQNPFVIEDRCSIGIEGHPRLLRYRTIR